MWNAILLRFKFHICSALKWYYLFTMLCVCVGKVREAAQWKPGACYICTFHVCRYPAKSVQAVQAVNHGFRDLLISEATCCRIYLPASLIGGAAILELSFVRPQSVPNEKRSEKFCKVIHNTLLLKRPETAKAVYSHLLRTKRVLQRQRQIQFKAAGRNRRHVLRKWHKPRKDGNIKSEKYCVYAEHYGLFSVLRVRISIPLFC